MRAVSSLQANKSDLKHWCAEMVSVGPATEPEKEEEEEAKKGDRRRKRMLMSRCQSWSRHVGHIILL
ncbi:unnamed protein product [Musa textilis]